MLVQAQVVALGKRGDRQSSPSRFHPVTSITHRQEDRRVRLQNRVDSGTARRAKHTLSRNEKFLFFFFPSPCGWFGGVFFLLVRVEKTPAKPAPQINPLFSPPTTLISLGENA